MKAPLLVLNSLKNFGVSFVNVIIESNRRRAAYETARILNNKPEFENWQFDRLYNHVLDEQKPIDRKEQE